MKTSKPLSLLSSLLTALAVLSGSIAAPLLCRPFYYAHIGPMGLAEYVGLTPEQIRQAFDQVMDFCLGLRPDFAAGVLPWSQSGADHFAGVRRPLQARPALLLPGARPRLLGRRRAGHRLSGRGRPGRIGL